MLPTSVSCEHILTRVSGSSPQKSGSKDVSPLRGEITGTLGCDCLEAEAQRLAIKALKPGMPETFELVLDHDFSLARIDRPIAPCRGLALPRNHHAASRKPSSCSRCKSISPSVFSTTYPNSQTKLYSRPKRLFVSVIGMICRTSHSPPSQVRAYRHARSQSRHGHVRGLDTSVALIPLHDWAGLPFRVNSNALAKG